jgi:class 3 adenylate cyclase/tetratricopeptide (TPR) repeat protein
LSESGNDNKIKNLIGELQRRKTFRVAAAYIVVAWVLIEGASVILPAFNAPEWILPGLIIALVAGLPVAVALSWIFDITPEGLQKTDDMDAAAELAGESPLEAPTELKPSIAIPLGSAQRRQVTLLRVAFRLMSDAGAVTDPEMILAVIPKLNELMERVSDRFTAYALDDAGPVYELLFGYPVAFENDAVRAVSAAFAILSEAQKITPDELSDASLHIDLSAAIHSDLVIIEDREDAAATVVGSSSVVATWLQTVAPSDKIIVSEATRRLLPNAIQCESLGAHVNPQTGESIEVYQAVRLLSPKDILSAFVAGEQTMVGRDSELALMLDRWEQVIDGEDQFIVLRGEPGIGKSTLVKAFVANVQENKSAQLMPIYCSPFETNNAFHPIVDFFLGAGFELNSAESDEHQAKRISRVLTDFGLDADEAGPLINAMLEFDHSRHGISQPADSAEAMRARLLKCLLDLFKAAATRGPVCLIFEDIHFADPSTLELISMMVNRESQAGAMCLFTARPTVKLDWESRSNVTVLDLKHLPRRVTENLVRGILGDVDISDDVLASIVAETGGNPLFAEELTRAVAESVSDSTSMVSEDLVLPGTIQQSLASRIDRLGDAKPVLQLCSLLGRKFDYKLLCAVSQTENEAALREGLRAIVNAEFLFQEGAVPDSVYRFKHVLVQETAASLLLKTTRTELHAHVAKIIETEFPKRADRKPGLLAFHYGEGGQLDQSVKYWMIACKKSLEVFAMQEAIEQAESGLHVIASMPESRERDSAEFRLRSMHGKGLLTLHGYADNRVEETFTRALELSQSLEDAPEIFPVVVGLWMYFVIGGEAEHALVVARRLVRIASEDPSPAKSLQAHYCVGHSLYRLGRYAESREELRCALSFSSKDADFASESASADDTRVHVRSVLAHVLWHLGDEESSLENIRMALEMAEAEQNPWGIEFASFMSAWLNMLRHEPAEAAEHADRTIAIAAEKGFKFWLAVGTFMSTWASHDAGRSAPPGAAEERLENFEKTLNGFLASGAVNGTTSLGLQVAEDMVSAGNAERAGYWLQKVREIIENTGERSFAADVLRVEGRLALLRGNSADAESLFEAARAAAEDVGSIGIVRRADSDLEAVRAGKTLVHGAI